MITDALEAIRKRDFPQASRIVGEYESKQIKLPSDNPMAIPSPARTIASDVEMLGKIFSLRPKILKDLSESDWFALHVARSLSHLLHGRFSEAWLPDGFVGVSKFSAIVAHRMLQFHLGHVLDIEKMRGLDIKKASIMCTGVNAGTCAACMKLNERTYTLDSLPQLPNERCTCDMGCRCYIAAEITF